ncbi:MULTISPECIES: helix-turn-helix domain-containing GNAT family N-acetyltransferase [Rhodopseudomonas]|uniref:MarR family transcriptional regulator n=1 Tax=Rhodopseudomonas palustris TaxID=1076 RepID=A0A0D7EL60_RHOPL|nr:MULTISPECIES: helix-turn-helix domain-containing GNAT family N-acetyltransferase [Rhodopseudomonas]KIZ41376.1 MarR family transcriptional regulator [Rhodopseudomonas palustris]MDF3810251.1 helix-turn-helix domain-containing GNAT family N-acetyltransferase [Rhodopseudomonas sp. BAL398]WOK15716.1 helix-turn-helix domain-containing GNAT family N-acetyltransferase [Rhodopseudomonas sp. BAL398]
MLQHVSDPTVAAVRAFNRFYTAKVGVLEQHLVHSPYSLTEARILYELAQRERPTAKAIGAGLGLDPGYLSRIIQNFDEAGLIVRAASPADRRQYLLALTAKGRAALSKLTRAMEQEVAAMLRGLGAGDRAQLIQAMATIERLLGAPPQPPAITLRPPRPGDIGWVVQSHGALYAAEYGFDASFEALVAQLASTFLASFDASRERSWIAELDGAPVGSVFLVRHSDQIAKLRLLLVDPAGRGHGLGQRLVGECIGFARQCGYRGITLWTQSILIAARQIYRNSGFELVATEPHRSFGQDLVGETWELKL